MDTAETTPQAPPAPIRVFVVEEILGAIEEDSLDRREGRITAVRVEEAKFSCSDSDGVEEVLLGVGLGAEPALAEELRRRRVDGGAERGRVEGGDGGR